MELTFIRVASCQAQVECPGPGPRRARGQPGPLAEAVAAPAQPARGPGIAQVPAGHAAGR